MSLQMIATDMSSHFMILVTIPLYLLYEVSIRVVKWIT